MAEDIETLIAMLDDSQTREEAAARLGVPDHRGDQRVLKALAAMLRDKGSADAFSYRIRQQAARALGAMGDPAAVPALTVALEDPHTAVKAAAADALGKIGDPAAIEGLIAALNDAASDARLAALGALEAVSAMHPVPVGPLVALLADPEDSLRQAAADAFVGLAQDDKFDALTAALTDPNSTIRGAAAGILGRLADERARGALKQTASDDQSEWVRSRAKWALSQLPPEQFEAPRVRRDAPPPPPDTLQLMRSQQPDRVTLGPRTAAGDPESMSAEQIQAMLDQLDVRLARGEISEATYKELAARWEARLKRLRNE